MTAGQLVVPSSSGRKDSSEWSVPFFVNSLKWMLLDPLAEDRNPVLGMLEQHDVAGVEVHAHVRAREAVDERVHLHRRHQIAVEEDVLDVERDLQLLGGLHERRRRLRARGDRRHRSAPVRDRRATECAPRRARRAGSPRRGRARPAPCCPASSRPRLRFAGSLLVSGYGQNRNEHRPLIAMPMLVGGAADLLELARCRLSATDRIRDRSSARCRRSPRPSRVAGTAPGSSSAGRETPRG